MTEATTRLAIRPDTPAAGSETEDRWAKDSTIAYDGGYIRSAYGNLVQTWNLNGLNSPSEAIDVDRAGYSVDRVLTIGMASKPVTYAPKTYKRFPRRNGSGAAGGEEMTFVTDIGQYTARVAGDVETLIQWITDNIGEQYGTLEVYTNRGAIYGPFGLPLE